MNDIILTIAIPSFDRNEILIKNLSVLIPQLNNSCELLIIDNCSPVPIEYSFNFLSINEPDFSFRIIRNNFNVGGNENILRCIEYANGEYVWLLGDDDIPAPNAINNILSDIKTFPEALVFNMNTISKTHQTRDLTQVVKGATAYLRSFTFFGEIIFISALVIKKNACFGIMKTAFLMQSTFVPQLFVVLLTLDEFGTCIISEKVVATNGADLTPPNKSASMIGIPIGFGGILDYKWESKTRRILRNHLVNLRKTWLTPFAFLNNLLEIRLDPSVPKSVSYNLYQIGWQRFYSLGSFINKEKLIYKIGFIVLIFPKFGYLVKKILLKMHGREVNPILSGQTKLHER